MAVRYVVFAGMLALARAACVPVQVVYPSGQMNNQAMYLRGSGGGLNWDKGVLMSYVGDDTWSTCVSAGNIEVKPLLGDSTWCNGANTFIGPNGGAVYPWFYSTNGWYGYLRGIYSPQLQNTRDLVIYVPPSYAENPYKNYSQVLLMHDGQNLFNVSTSAFGTAWLVQNAADELIMEGTIPELVIVGVDNTDERIYEYTYSQDPGTPGGGGADKYLDFLHQTVLPLVLQNVRVAEASMEVGMMGSSLGGLVTCYAGWTRPGLYAKLGCMSSSFWWNNQDFNGTILNKPKPQPMPLIYMDSGNVGSGEQEIEADTGVVYQRLLELGLKPNATVVRYLANGGQHNEASWGARVHVPLAYLYGGVLPGTAAAE